MGRTASPHYLGAARKPFIEAADPSLPPKETDHPSCTAPSHACFPRAQSGVGTGRGQEEQQSSDRGGAVPGCHPTHRARSAPLRLPQPQSLRLPVTPTPLGTPSCRARTNGQVPAPRAGPPAESCWLLQNPPSEIPPVHWELLVHGQSSVGSIRGQSHIQSHVLLPLPCSVQRPHASPRRPKGFHGPGCTYRHHNSASASDPALALHQEGPLPKFCSVAAVGLTKQAPNALVGKLRGRGTTSPAPCVRSDP